MKQFDLKHLKICLLFFNLLLFGGLSSVSAQTVADFPFLANEIDEDNCCKNESVIFYATPSGDFIYIRNNVECFGGGGRLFLADGTFYCEDTNISCLEFYGLTNGLSIFECTAPIEDAAIDLFDRFPFLSGVVDVNNCMGEVIEFYRNDLGHEFICFVNGNSRTWHYSDGTVACTSSGTFDCVSAYGFGDMQLIETFVCEVDADGGDDGDDDGDGDDDTDDIVCDVDGGVLSGGPFEFCVGDDTANTIDAGQLTLTGANTAAVAVQFEFEVLQPADGFFVTEPWVGLHDGSFDLFNIGERATPGLESLAEGGNTAALGAEFAQPGRLQATIGNGNVQFTSPGETISGSIDIRNPQNYRYASFATMIIPSNDGFFGNENPLEFEVFDENGNFNGPIDIVLTGADLWDAGTEVNNASGAAGFSQGFDGSGSGPSTDDPTSTVSTHPGLANLVGLQTAAGTTIGSDGAGALDADEPILRVRITVGEAINTVQAVGPPFEGSVVEDADSDDSMAAVQFQFEVLQPGDGFFITEPWVGLHNGSFDLFNFGERATPGLESLAEGGNTELLGSEFAQAGRLQATIGNGNVQFISPGETISGSIDIRNPLNYRYASFASMIIPSNDGFFGNENPLAFEVFDENGNPTGPIEIVLTGADLWDAGTEVNNASGAAGFSQGFDGSGSGPSTDDPTSTVSTHPGLDNIVGLQTAAGTTIGSMGGGPLDPNEPILRITISVGEPINTVQAVGPPFEGSAVEAAAIALDAVQFEFEVMQPADGFFITEPWVGLHNGSFDLFNFGERATPGLESLAEGGNTLALGAEFAQPGRLQATIGNGNVQFISPGETISGSIDVRNPLNYRYASFASMIIPSNDGFFGNENPLEFEIFDENGNPTGPIEIVLTGADLWDAGTEVNNASGAAGFSQGFDGSGSGLSTDDPTSTVSTHPGLDNIVGLQTAAGTTIGSNGGGSLDPNEPILRIRISVGESINTVQAVGPAFEGSFVPPSEGFIVADASGQILGITASISDFDFNSVSEGSSNVFFFASMGDVTGLEVGGNINNIEGCFDLSNPVQVNTVSCANGVGAVYAMTNGEGQIAGNVQGPNSVVAYSQAEDGTLTVLGSFPTGGNGGDFDGGEGLDPLISAYALTKTLDNRFVLAVNAGSNTVTSMTINDDYSLTVADTESTIDIGPNSIAYTASDIDGVNGLIYVSNITRQEFLALGEPGHQGSIIGYWLMDDGSLQPVDNGVRNLANRPSAVQFSPGGDFIVVSSINAGASGLGSGSQDEIVVYTVNADGSLSANQTAGATSTLRDNAEGRNLPSAIGFQVVGDNFVVVTEAREFRPNGLPPIFPALQDGSVSTWQIGAGGTLTAIDLDVASGVNNTGRTACWLDFSDDNTFFVSNAIEAGLASYSFDNGSISLLNQTAAQGTGTGGFTDPAAAFGNTEGWIDMWISDDNQYLYQCFGLTGEVGVYAINGAELTFLQVIGGLPQNNVQGIVSVGEIGVTPPPTPSVPVAAATGPAVGAVYAMTNGEGQVEGNVQGPNSVVAYAQAADGTLTEMGSFPTGGNGGDFDGGEGLDPLISAYALTKSLDNRFVLAVNAGSNTVTSMVVNDDYSLTVADTESTIDVGPNSIAYTASDIDGVNGLIYVSNITRQEFLALGEPGHQGSIIGYWLMDDGSLQPVDNGVRNLANRPSAVQFSPNGDFVVVASINAGASGLGSGSQDEIVVYTVNADGSLSANQTAGATSTLRDNAEGRNLPSAIGFQVVGDNYVVVTEAREFQPNGLPPVFPALQDGSVSTWQIGAGGTLTAIDLDVASGTNNTGRTACWLDFSDDNTFFVSNAIEAGLASYSFNDGNIELLNQVAAQGTGATGNTTDGASAFATTEGWIDMWISDDNQFLYQCYGLTGEVGVYAIDGSELSLIQEIGGLPQNNVQGIVSLGEIGVTPAPTPSVPDVAVGPGPTGPAVGAVYAMTNGEGQVEGNVQGPNSVVAYAQAADGTLSVMGSFATGGTGGDFDGGEGLDPLISAYALTKSLDNRFVLAVNAGSNTVTSMVVNDDYSLTVADTESTIDVGPNSIAYTASDIDGVNGLIYVSNITRQEFLALGEPGHQGSIIGYWLMDDGSLQPVDNGVRNLANRPSAVQFSPNGDFVVVASINAGASGLGSGSQDEIVVYTVNADGSLSANQTAGATSTLRDNAEGRNLPSAIGFQVVGDNYVVVTEAREFQPNGLPPVFPALQDGSVSTWQIGAGGTLTAIDLDVASGTNNTGRTACWLDFSDDNTFFVSNAIEAGLASYSFNDGDIELLNQVAAQGTGATGNTTDGASAFATTEGWIDMWISDDNQFLYQCYGLTGEVGVYAIDGADLTLVQEIGGLPQNNVQGIVSVGEIGVTPAPTPSVPAVVAGPTGPAVGAVYAMTNGEGQVPGNVQGPNSVVAYAQAADGTLSVMGSFPTGGNGGDFDGGEGLDPLISAYAITKSLDNRFVLAVNAGSNTVTAMAVNEDFTLSVTDTESTIDVGPNSIAYTPSNIDGVNGLIYVSNITRQEFLALGEPGHQGSILGFWLLDDGTLQPIGNSIRDLANRPSAIQFSPNGDYIVVASINAGASGLGSGSEDEIVLYGVNDDGTLSADQLAGATSTLRDNPDGRNLPSAIGFQIVGDNYVVVTEAREFQPNGLPPAFPALQDGSVSTWQIFEGSLVPINLDVPSGTNNTGRTACWLDFSDENTFFVSNAIEAGLASYSFDDGNIALLNQVAAQGTGATGNTTDPAAAFGTTEGWIDMWISDDNQFLYQCYGLTGEVGVYAIDGSELSLIQEIGGLPQNNVQGIVSVGAPTDASATAPEEDVATNDSDIIITEVFASGAFAIQNNGTEDIDVSEYYICTFPRYTRLEDLTLECGNLVMSAGEEIVLSGFVDGVNLNDAELGLYINNQFGNPASLRSYVDWGVAGGGRSSEAIAAGIWTDGDVVASFPANGSLVFDGLGILSSDWNADSNATFCNDNGLTLDDKNGISESSFITSSIAEMTVYPNPTTSGQVSVNFNLATDSEVTLTMLSIDGASTRVTYMNGENMRSGVHTETLDISSISNGVYIIQISTPTGILNEKLVVQN